MTNPSFPSTNTVATSAVVSNSSTSLSSIKNNTHGTSTHSHSTPTSSNAQSVVLVTGGYDHTIKFWEPLSGVSHHSVPYTDSQINALKVTPDKAFVAAAGNPKIRFYDIPSGHPNPVLNFEGHKSNVINFQLASNMKWFVSCSEDKTVKIWDIRTSAPTREFDHPASVTDVKLHPLNEAQMITSDMDGNVNIWDLQMNQCLHQLIPEPESAIQSLTVSMDGETLVAGAQKGHCYIWKWTPSELQPLKQLLAHKKFLLKCRWSPNNKYLLTCSADTTMKLWSTHNHSFQLLHTFSGHQRWVWDATFSSDAAYLVSASSDHTAKLWDTNSGKCIREYQGHQKALMTVTLHDQKIMTES